MPLISTRGVASAKALGLADGLAATYIEDVFSTYLYTGTGASQTITNNIALSTKGGMVWMKSRSAATDHAIYDTARGATFDIASNLTDSQTTQATGLTAFGTTGFTIGSLAKINTSAATYVSWTFRKQPKFFDIVTYTGNGVAGHQISHNLGSVPGFIVVKSTSHATIWAGYHRSLDATKLIRLNTTDAAITNSTMWNDTEPTSTVFSVGTAQGTNEETLTYVAYLFAHNAGGFGLTGADNVISCGSYTGNGSATGPVVTLGWEPQWVLIKRSSSTGDWNLIDNMRGFTVGGTDAELNPNLASAESTGTFVTPTATGFQLNTTDAGYNASGGTYVYIAIRRGLIRAPTSGTSVYKAVARTGAGAVTVSGVGFATDLLIDLARGTNLYTRYFIDRLRGVTNTIMSDVPDTENTGGNASAVTSFTMDGMILGASGNNKNSETGKFFVSNFFRCAPGFFDVVCYTGTGANKTETHNLTVAPELWIVKGRSGATAWTVGCTALANTEYLVLNTTAAKASDATAWNSTFPSSTVLSLGTRATVNTSAATYVAYLFATLAGISKVGSYTGNGTSQTIACGFATGARFILIKRTDVVGDWYVWDSTRGIVAGNDPHLSLNTIDAEVTTDDSVDTDSSGFIVNQFAATDINISAATYIFLAIS